MKRVVKIVLIMSLFGLFSTCINPFAPQLDTSSEMAFVLTEQKTPDDALDNFKYAYTTKDSFVYADVLDSAFIFQFSDPEDNVSNRIITWGRNDDLKSTGKLFRSFTTIDLNWGKNNLWELNEDSYAERTRTFKLHLSGPAGDFLVNGAAVFAFRKSPYDLKWRISRWQDGL